MSNDWKSKLAARLKAARVGMGSQAELATRAGISDRMIGLIEHGKLERPPRPVTVAKLAVAVGERPEEWLAIVGKKMSADEIAALRKTIRVKARLDEIEPAEKIKDQLRAEMEVRLRELIDSLEEVKSHIRDYQHPRAIKTEIEGRILDYIRKFDPPEKIKKELRQQFQEQISRELSQMQPAIKLREELLVYVNTRLLEFQSMVNDFDARLRQVAAWQIELMKRLDSAPAPKKHLQN